MSTRKLNIPALGFEVIVVGASDSTNKVVADMLEKKVATELTEVPEEIWGKHWGYCAWCVDTEIFPQEPIWEYAVDSRDLPVKYACCTKCAADRDVDQEPQGCKHCGNVDQACACKGGL
jgi:hypothetical protein